MTQRSSRLFQRAKKTMPGGVNSPVRAFGSVGGVPRFIKQAQGCRVTDADGKTYIDYVGSWGPLILGHAPSAVQSALRRQIPRGTSYGASTENEIILAETICEAIPSIEKVRLVNSGTEAVMSAVRLARAFTARPKIIKFDGGYHGHSDGLLVKAGSGVATLGIPDTPGVAKAQAELTLSLPYNDLESVKKAFKLHRSQIAAVVIEPVAGNMGIVTPRKGFLAALRKLTRQHGALLIFDEVITGFRVGYGGAQQLYAVKPDLTCLGKIIGGGLPVGAYGGKKAIMKWVAPEGPVYQAGTLSGNPMAVAAGIATLKVLRGRDVYGQLERKASRLVDGILESAKKTDVPIQVNRIGSMFTVFFNPDPVVDFGTAQRSDRTRYGCFFHGLLQNGVYFPPSQFEATFVSLAHKSSDLGQTIRAVQASLAAL